MPPVRIFAQGAISEGRRLAVSPDRFVERAITRLAIFTMFGSPRFFGPSDRSRVGDQFHVLECGSARQGTLMGFLRAAQN
jgi:hypothetical protein